jgi:nucleotide-binding universal stress UspA family protein
MDSQANNIVLVPTDFTTVADNAIHQACLAAKHLNYKVCLLHVIDKTTKSALKKDNLTPESIKEKLQQLCTEITSVHGVEAYSIAQEGSIFTTIADVAKEIGAKLLYMGTHGKVGIEQRLTGSFALKVVTGSPAPVVVVQKRSFDKGYHNIVLPITSDAGPWEKTKWASYIAQNFNATIHIFRLAGNEIDVAVNTMTSHFDKAHVKYTVKTAEKSGDFSKQVIAYATAENTDLIMIMTNPGSGVSTFILGSYDEEMIFNISQIPVMCINPRDFNWTKIVDY